MAGIVSYGAYIPYYRLPRSEIGKTWGRPEDRGEKAVANHDEDSITMSVAAGTDCLTGIDPKTVEALFMATTTAPYKERHNSTIVARALDIGREARTADFANCLRAGTIALSSGIDAVNAGACKKVLVVTADTRLGAVSGENEQVFGDGAAALLLGSEKVAVEIECIHSLSEDFVDNWRAHNDTFVRSWEDRFTADEGHRMILAEAAAGVMKKCGLSPRDFARICFYGSNSRRHKELGKALGFGPGQIQDPMFDTVGNTGTALPLMILVAALEEVKPGDRILLVSWGSGSDAIVMRATDEIEKIRNRRGIKRHLQMKVTLDSYGRYLRWRGLVEPEPAHRPEKLPTSLSSLWREHGYALPLYGVKCRKCGTPQLYLNSTSTRARICIECHAKDEFEPYRFGNKKGRLTSFSHDYLAVSDDPPNTIAIVDFEGGGRGAFDMADRDPGECKVGLTVEMTFRRMFFDKGIHNYYWKCKPLRD